jgi:DNA-directed RNA polymerase subunit alpha
MFMEDEFFELTYRTPVREEEMPRFWHPQEKKKQLPRTKRYLKYLADLELSVRTTSFLETAGITKVTQLISHNADELLELRNFGMTSLMEVRQKLADHGILLKGD